MRSLPLKLAPGSDLRLSLEELARRDGLHGSFSALWATSPAAFHAWGRLN